jgi:hypothetical protein
MMVMKRPRPTEEERRAASHARAMALEVLMYAQEFESRAYREAKATGFTYPSPEYDTYSEAKQWENEAKKAFAEADRAFNAIWKRR